MPECETEAKPNFCVGDEYELQIECWNCSHNWVIFRFAAEKEMSAKCPQCGMWNKRALQQALADTEIIEGYLNSPQFTKQYAKLSDVEKVLSELPVWDDDFQLEKVLNLIRRIE